MIIIGFYNVFGYQIVKYNPENSRIEELIYQASNHKFISEIWVSPEDKNALSLKEIKDLCEKATKELTKEYNRLFKPEKLKWAIEYDKDSEKDLLESL
jgi:TorA maturation chaperone TorD